MKEILTVREEIGEEFVNDITREMDKHLIKDFSNIGWNTYIYERRLKKNVLTLRYPGATKGRIEVDDNMVVVDVIIYEPAEGEESIYKETAEKAVRQFIGSKITFKNGEKIE